MPIMTREEFENYVRTRVNTLLPGVSLLRREQVISFFVEVALNSHNYVIDDVDREIGLGPTDPNLTAYDYAMALKETVNSWRWTST